MNKPTSFERRLCLCCKLRPRSGDRTCRICSSLCVRLAALHKRGKLLPTTAQRSAQITAIGTGLCFMRSIVENAPPGANSFRRVLHSARVPSADIPTAAGLHAPIARTQKPHSQTSLTRALLLSCVLITPLTACQRLLGPRAPARYLQSQQAEREAIATKCSVDPGPP